MDVFRYCSDAPFVYPSRPIKSCRRDRVLSMDVFRHCSITPFVYTSLHQSNLVGTYVHFLWPFSSIVRHRPFLHSVTSPFLSPLSGPTCIVYGRFSALFGRPFCIPLSANQILSAGPCIISWTFSGIVRHGTFLHSETSPIRPPLSAPTFISYGRFPALFGRPFCIPLSANKILSAGPCIVYGRFPTLFSRFVCSIEMLREPRRSTIVPSFEIVLTSQTIISKRANESDISSFYSELLRMYHALTVVVKNGILIMNREGPKFSTMTQHWPLTSCIFRVTSVVTSLEGCDVTLRRGHAKYSWGQRLMLGHCVTSKVTLNMHEVRDQCWVIVWRQRSRWRCMRSEYLICMRLRRDGRIRNAIDAFRDTIDAFRDAIDAFRDVIDAIRHANWRNVRAIGAIRDAIDAFCDAIDLICAQLSQFATRLTHFATLLTHFVTHLTHFATRLTQFVTQLTQFSTRLTQNNTFHGVIDAFWWRIRWSKDKYKASFLKISSFGHHPRSVRPYFRLIKGIRTRT